MMYGISLLIIEWSHASVFKRNQIKYLIAGVVVGIFGGATTFFPIFGIKIYPFGTYLVPFYVLTVAYAIITYRLMDIEVVIARSSILFCVYSAVLFGCGVAVVSDEAVFAGPVGGQVEFCANGRVCGPVNDSAVYLPVLSAKIRPAAA